MVELVVIEYEVLVKLVKCKLGCLVALSRDETSPGDRTLELGYTD